MLLILISPRTFPEEQLSKVNRMKGRKKHLILDMFSFLLHLPEASFSPKQKKPPSLSVLCYMKGQRQRRTAGPHTDLSSVAPFGSGSARAAQAWRSPIALCPLLTSDCKHKWLQKPESPFNKVIFKEIFLCTRKAMARMHWQMAPEFALRVQKKSSRGCSEAAERRAHLSQAGSGSTQPLLSCRNDQSWPVMQFSKRRRNRDFVQISQFLKAGNY